MRTLRELAAVAELQLEVIDAAGGLEREIQRSHVTELPDPRKYLRAGELVLTNGLWNRDEEACARFAEALAASSVCGLVYGLLSEVPEVPQALVRACRRLGLPLLSLAIDVPFAHVSETLARLQGEERQRALTASVQRGEALVEAVAADAGPADLLALLTREHPLPVAVLDRVGRPLASSGLVLSESDVRAVADAVTGPLRAELALQDGVTATLFRVSGRAGTEALLVCARALVDLTSAERTALEQTARFLSLELTRRESVGAVAARFAAELVEILTDAARRAPELPGRLRSYGLQPEGPLVALSAACLGDDQSPPVLAGELARLWAATGELAVVSATAEDVVLIADWPGSRDELQRAAETVAAGVAGTASRVVLGVGRLAGGHAELPRSLAGAREARRAAQRQPDGPAVLGSEGVGSFRSLLDRQDPQLLDEFVLAVLSPLRRHDREHGTQLELTVRTFLDTGGRWSTAAEELHVHVNTLRNRLRRIEELTGRDLQQTEDRVDLHLALHASGR